MVNGANLKASLQKSLTLGPLSKNQGHKPHEYIKFSHNVPTQSMLLFSKSLIVALLIRSLLSQKQNGMCRQNNLETASEHYTHLSNFTFGSARTRGCWMRSFTTLRALKLLVGFVLNHFASLSRDRGIRLRKQQYLNIGFNWFLYYSTNSIFGENFCYSNKECVFVNSREL